MVISAGIVLAVIVLGFVLSRALLKLGVELSLLVAAVVGGVFYAMQRALSSVAGDSITPLDLIRHLVEGSFTYFDVCLIFITATLFINLIKESGGITFIVRNIVARFYNHRFICLLLLTIIMLIPGALTGSGAATILTVGALVGAVLLNMGVSKTKTVAAVFLCACMGAVAPPINLWAMMAAAGSNMPYTGFFLPLLVLSLFGALFSMFWLAGRSSEAPDYDRVMAALPLAPEGMNWARVLIPFILFLGLILAGRLLPFAMPILGLPLVFVISAIAAVLCSPKRLKVFDIAGQTIRSLIPLVGVMVVLGILIQIMALSGARGLISLAVVSLPLTVLFATLWLILPVSEGALQYAVAPLLGVPLVMLFNMQGLNVIIALSAMSVMWALGDCLPPTAVVGRATVMELEYKGRYYGEFVKTCLFPMLVILLVSTLFIIYSRQLSFLVGG